VYEQQPFRHLSFSDIAILYRTSGQNKFFSNVFDSAGIPYQTVSRQNIFNAKYIGEMISLLKVMEGTGSYADFERGSNITTPKMNKQSLEIFKNWCYEKRFSLESGLINARRIPIHGMGNARQRKLTDLIDTIFKIKQKTKRMPMEEKLSFLAEYTKLSASEKWSQTTKDTLKHLIDICARFDSNTTDFLKTAALQTDTDMYNHQTERVALMTMHAAKGLEFPVVFIAGCEKGLMPFQRSDTDETDIEEERRLFYVAMTRAQERLYLTFAKKRRIFGKIEKRTLSPFVRKIEDKLLTLETAVPKKKTKAGPLQLKLF